MIRETFRRLAVALVGLAGWGQAPASSKATASFAPMEHTAPSTRVRGNAYQWQPGGGPGAAARRRKAIRRTAKPTKNCLMYNTIHGPFSRAALLEMQP